MLASASKTPKTFHVLLAKLDSVEHRATNSNRKNADDEEHRLEYVIGPRSSLPQVSILSDIPESKEVPLAIKQPKFICNGCSFEKHESLIEGK